MFSNNSYDSPPNFDLGRCGKSTKSDWPVPFVFGGLKAATQHNKMVNERSPAKAPLHPVEPNDQPQLRKAEMSPTAKAPLSNVPQFGQPTMPQSPLHRPPPKQSSVFIQPKSRPEHHRDGQRPGKNPCIHDCILFSAFRKSEANSKPFPAHPHLQAFKDATKEIAHKVLDPLVAKAPASFQPENKYA